MPEAALANTPQPPYWRKWLRWLAAPITIALAAGFLYASSGQLRANLHNGIHAAPVPVLLAILMAILPFVAMAQVLRLMLAAGRVRVPLRTSTGMVLAANAWSSTFPGGPAIATVWSFQVLRRWGTSEVLSSWQILLSGALSTMWLAALGIGCVLFLGAEISPASLSFSMLGALLLLALLYGITAQPQLLAPSLQRLTRTACSLLGRAPERALAVVAQQLNNLGAVRLRPTRFGIAAWWSLLNWVLDIVCLWACVWAVQGVPPLFSAGAQNPAFLTHHLFTGAHPPLAVSIISIPGVVLCFIVAKLVGSVGVAPGGLGPVDAALVGSLIAAGMGTGLAVQAVVIYRLCSLLLVAIVGWVIYGLCYSRQLPTGLGNTVAPSTPVEPK